MQNVLLTRFKKTRQITEDLCSPLLTEDYLIQGMIDVSPPKWHLAHTSWFFETFILKKYFANYKIFDENFKYLFNSYYEGLGKPYPRGKRGLLSRPTVQMTLDYRQYINQHIET